jgi:hypothetical protein
MTNKYNEPVYSKNVIEMLTVANDFCLFIEETDKYTKEDFLLYMQKICPLLYLKASLLPALNVEDETDNEHFVTEEQWQNVFDTLKQKFSSDDLYWYIDNYSDAKKKDIKHEKSSLAEDFADIYQDLKDFVLLYQKNIKISKESAVCECKKLFETHWGYKIVNIQKVIHYLLY